MKVQLETEMGRMLFFNFLPLYLGEINGFKVRFHLYTMPGVVLEKGLKLILKGVDGVVFVADSRIGLIEANQELMEHLGTNLAEYGYSLDQIPYVIQYNKRDLPEIVSVLELQSVLNSSGNVPHFPTVALTGFGVLDTLKAVANLIIMELKKGT